MKTGYKTGAGNKPEKYILAGQGEKSGEYTKSKTTPDNTIAVRQFAVKNIRYRFNFCHSKLVGYVSETSICGESVSIPANGKPNSVVKKVIHRYVVTERYYNEKGEAYLDIDYTCHGNPKAHPKVPHIHRWFYDNNGNLVRGVWEDFQ